MQFKVIKSCMVSLAVMGIAAGVSGCATTDTAPQTQGKTASNKVEAVEEKSVITGSRIPTRTTEKLVRSTSQDKADEPVRSIGNLVGQKSN
jgi:hypothetical protein